MELSPVQEVDSQITDVTVFSDRAMITRKARVSLEPGEQKLLLPNLPEQLEEKSVQVNGSGGGTLRDIRTNLIYFSDTPVADRNDLFEEKTALEDSLLEIQDAIARANSGKEFLERITGRITGLTEKAAPAELDPESWTKMLSFYRKQLEGLDKEIREKGIKKRETEERLRAIENQIMACGNVKEWVKHQIELTIHMERKCEIEFSVSYIVSGPSWRPVYNLRADSDEGNILIEYDALVRQNTGEHWTDAAVSLSTANPRISGTVPELSGWFVDICKPLPPPVLPAAAPLAKERSAKSLMGSGADMDEGESGAFMIAEAEPELPMEMEKPAAGVTEGSSSVVFSIPGTTSVMSDNSDYRITVMEDRFPADFHYESVPKLSPYAYLQSKVTNGSEYPLLPGDTSIFLDGCFVANSAIKFIAPEEEFHTSLGVDESIKVEHKLLKRFIKKEGLLGKRETMVYEYRIDITNNKKTDQRIIIKDNIPISGDQELSIKLLKPVVKDSSEELSIDEEQILTWTRTVKPKENLSLPFSFSVEYPAGTRLSGI